MANKSTKKNADTTVLVLAVIGSLVLLNVIGGATYLGRLDMTGDGQFTLAEATEDTLRRLHDPVTIRAYFSKDMPPQLASISRYVQDLLEEFAAKGGAYVRYEFIDPLAEETEEDKEKKKDVKQDVFGRQFREMTEIERELQGLGIPSVNVRVKEGESVEQRRVYMGLAIHYGKEKEVIPVIQDTGTLEYNLTSMLRKLTRDTTPKLTFVRGAGSINPEETMGQLYGLLQQVYEVSSIDMTTETTIPEGTNAIVVLGTTAPYSDAARRALDAYVSGGGAAAFFLDAIKPDLKTMTPNEFDDGLADMIEMWGIKIEDGLVLDVECDNIGIARRIGPIVVPEPVAYHYMPAVKALNADNPITRGLANVVFPFTRPLTVTAPSDGAVKGALLVESSPQAWIETAPYKLDPTYRWTKEDAGELTKRGLVATLMGPLPSFFNSGAEAVGEESEAGGNARVLVAGGTGFIDAEMTRQRETNMAFVLNLTDWLLADEALLAMRARGLSAAPLDPELKDGTKATVKYLNILGLPLAFVAFGLIRWRSRESRRSRVAL